MKNEREKTNVRITFNIAKTAYTKIVQIADENLTDNTEIYRQITLNVVNNKKILKKVINDIKNPLNVVKVKPETTRTTATFNVNDYLNILEIAESNNIRLTKLLRVIAENFESYLKPKSVNPNPAYRTGKFKSVTIKKGISTRLVNAIKFEANRRKVSVNQQITDILFDRVAPIRKTNKIDIFSGKKTSIEFKVRKSEFTKRFIYLDEAKDKLYNYFTDKKFTDITIDIPVTSENDYYFIYKNRETIEKTIYREILKPHKKEDKKTLVKKIKSIPKVKSSNIVRIVQINIKLNDREYKNFGKIFGKLTFNEVGYYFANSSKFIETLDTSVVRKPCFDNILIER